MSEVAGAGQQAGALLLEALMGKAGMISEAPIAREYGDAKSAVMEDRSKDFHEAALLK